MVIRRINPVSAAKLVGLLYAALGLLIGACVSLVVMMIGGAAEFGGDQRGGALFGMLFGAGAIIILPVFYGVLGFIVTLITAALYNVAAKMTGGIEIDVQ